MGAKRQFGRICNIRMTVYAGTFVFGHGNDVRACFDEALEFSLRQKLFLAAFNHLVPFPGTPLYRQLEVEGRLLYDKWWLDPQVRFGDVVFQPYHMTPQELSATCFEYRQRFYSARNVLSRGLDLQANCASLRQALLFLTLNLFSGREVTKRQGLPLGANL